MKKAITYFILLVLSAGYLQAQASDSLSFNAINLSIGFQNNYLKDDVFSPLNQQGNGLQFGLGYRRTVKNIFGVSLKFGSGELNGNEAKMFSDSFMDINIGLEYLAKIPNKNRSTNFYFGGAYETRALFIEWNGLDAFSYTSIQGFSIKGLMTKKINSKHSIESSVGIPVFQFLGRPPYNGIDEFIIENQDSPVKIMLKGKPTSFDQYLGLDCNLGYNYKITPRWVWNIDYSLFIQKVKNVHQFKRFSSEPSTGLSFNF